jgi:nucleoside-diphosphate-sugar epimerase
MVSGAGGFIAMHCILQLLQQGYRVRGTLRNLAREGQLRKTLAEHVDADDRLEFARADLLEDDGWQAALSGCDYVLHVASPFPAAAPKHEDDLIIPARDGALRVLRAAVAGNVKRVVLTSSMVAILDGHEPGHRNFDEKDWSNLDGKIGAYAKSKTLAERAAWDFIENLEGASPLELAVINPSFVMGPYLGGDLATSGELISKLMRREVPGVPRIRWFIVDVRDVAAAHIAAMTIPEAAGQRFCCSAHTCSTQEIALILERHFASRGYRIPTREVPDFVVRLVAVFDKTVRLTVDALGKEDTVFTKRIEKTLNWQPRPLEETIVEMAESMIREGMV